MNKTLAWFAGLLTLCGSFGAQCQQKPGELNKSLLWSITGNKLTKPSYLFGTIHVICIDDYLWTNKMKESLDKSEKVCFEMDLDDPSVIVQVATGLMDTSGKKLPDYFTPDQYALLRKYIKDTLGMDISVFETLKPIALQSVIGTSGVNCPNPISYEDSIMKTAQKSNKEILGLEAPQEQLSALESIPTDSVVQQLMDELQNGQKSDSEYNQLIDAYKKQDLPELYKLITSSNEMGDDMGVFLDDRNKKWIPRMSDKMKISSVFFAVGAGHLWGDKGIITLLRKAGYTVKPLKG